MLINGICAIEEFDSLNEKFDVEGIELDLEGKPLMRSVKSNNLGDVVGAVREVRKLLPNDDPERMPDWARNLWKKGGPAAVAVRAEVWSAGTKMVLGYFSVGFAVSGKVFEKRSLGAAFDTAPGKKPEIFTRSLLDGIALVLKPVHEAYRVRVEPRCVR